MNYFAPESSDNYHALIAQVDKLTARLTAKYADHLNCRAGCSHCCQHHLSVFPVEAATISAAVQALPEAIRQQLRQQAARTREGELRHESVACPLLLADRCAIYEARPLICRTQGLPLLYQAEDGQPEVDFCPLNFTAEAALNDLTEDHLVPLDELNLRLAAINVSYCREQGLQPAAERIRMADIIIGVTGKRADETDENNETTGKDRSATE